MAAEGVKGSGSPCSLGFQSQHSDPAWDTLLLHPDTHPSRRCLCSCLEQGTGKPCGMLRASPKVPCGPKAWCCSCLLLSASHPLCLAETPLPTGCRLRTFLGYPNPLTPGHALLSSHPAGITSSPSEGTASEPFLADICLLDAVLYSGLALAAVCSQDVSCIPGDPWGDQPGHRNHAELEGWWHSPVPPLVVGVDKRDSPAEWEAGHLPLLKTQQDVYMTDSGW